MRADGKLPGLEFKVAVEEASRVGARCALIDQDYKLTLEKVAKASSWKVIWNSLRIGDYKDIECTRSYVQKANILGKNIIRRFSVLTGRNRSNLLLAL
ncbi:hypothetical protein MKW92_010646 [Papaver armeniacum]|nr:hypothetical protein MKW92_010646 [Papaver armeniacum]